MFFGYFKNVCLIRDRYCLWKMLCKIFDDDDSSGISSSDYGDVISGNVRRSDVKMGSR